MHTADSAILHVYPTIHKVDLKAVSIAESSHAGGVFEVEKLWGWCMPDYIVTGPLVVPMISVIQIGLIYLPLLHCKKYLVIITFV